jgi:hydroxyethylthiazole kinase-like uncharacterized protein yjeF
VPSNQVLTVAQMRAAEAALIDAGESVESLMERAGKGAAHWVWRIAAGRAVTVLCGPGNNGGDGYVIARELAARGLQITVVAPLEPATPAAIAARQSYSGAISTSGKGGVLVDCLFGSGLSRPLDPQMAGLLNELAAHHSFTVAVDLPSGIDADKGQPLNSDLPDCDLTLALGAWKPAHSLMPAMAAMGEQRLVPIGVAAVEGAAQLVQRPRLAAPAPDAHKYSRGLILVVEGRMPGAALLACSGALHGGAGAVRLTTDRTHPMVPPDIVLRGEPLEQLLADRRTGAVIVGPGLGEGEAAKARLQRVLTASLPTVLDADALRSLAPADLTSFASSLILTPHAGEMAQLTDAFGLPGGTKVEQAQALASAARAVVISKGADTVIAAPDGRVAFAPSASSWLSVGGSGDVLAGIVASRLAASGNPFRAACEGVWLHGEAARLAGPAFLASELAAAIPAAIATCL